MSNNYVIKSDVETKDLPKVLNEEFDIDTSTTVGLVEAIRVEGTFVPEAEGLEIQMVARREDVDIIDSYGDKVHPQRDYNVLVTGDNFTLLLNRERGELNYWQIQANRK